MAKISSNVGLDMTKLYFYEVTAGAYNSSYSNNAYVSYNNITYEDVVEVDWVAGSNIYASLFGGYSITLSSAGAINGGTGTGYLLLSWTGASWTPVWLLENISVNATSLYSAFLTPSATDDFTLIRSGLSGADTLNGSSFNDYLTGYAGNDTFDGSSGNDTIDGGAGDDLINGGIGTDLAIYTGGSSARFSTKISSGVFNVRGDSTNFGSDLLTNVEYAQFADLTLETKWFSNTSALTTSQSDSLVELYVASFNRAPDAIGLNYWGGRFYDGMSLSQIAKSFFVQPETVAAYPSTMPTRTFVTTVYNNVLSRAPDTDGLNYWTREIDTGNVSKDVFLLAIINGAKASTGSATDRQTLSNKVAVGNHFAFDDGLNDTTWGVNVMSSVTSATSTVTAANALADSYYNSISTGGHANAMPVDLLGVDVSNMNIIT